MNLMIISDIHGIKTNLPKIEEKFKQFNCDKLIVLGDLYYIGPRNKIQQEYDIQTVNEFLNSMKDKIICIKGNCDSEVDKMVSDFPIIDDLGMINIDNYEFYLTHGHIYNENHWIKNNSILLYGHLHVPFIKEKDGNIYLNPGSISLPKDNYKPSYLIYKDNEFTIYDINDNILAKKTLK